MKHVFLFFGLKHLITIVYTKTKFEVFGDACLTVERGHMA